MNRLRFFSAGVRAVLECNAIECRFEADHLAPNWQAVLLEVFWQPRDHRGLPEGPAFLVYHAATRVLTVPGRDIGWAVWRLKGVGPQLAAQCHYRISEYPSAAVGRDAHDRA